MPTQASKTAKPKPSATTSLHTFIRQFIATAVAPNETSPKTLQYYYDQWRQDCRGNEQSLRLLEDRYEQKYNQPRLAIESARRIFEGQSGALKEDGQSEWHAFMASRPISKPSNIFTKHILE